MADDGDRNVIPLSRHRKGGPFAVVGPDPEAAFELVVCFKCGADNGLNWQVLRFIPDDGGAAADYALTVCVQQLRSLAKRRDVFSVILYGPEGDMIGCGFCGNLTSFRDGIQL